MSKASASCSSCPATPAPAPVTAEKPKAANKIVFELDDELSTKSDGIIKIKKIKQLLNKDLKLFTIVGHVKNFTKLNNSLGKSHHKLNFIIQEKKTNKVGRMAIDILLDVNTKQGNGTVTLFVWPPDAASKTKGCLCSQSNCWNADCGTAPGTSFNVSSKDNYVILRGPGVVEPFF